MQLGTPHRPTEKFQVLRSYAIAAQLVSAGRYSAGCVYEQLLNADEPGSRAHHRDSSALRFEMKRTICGYLADHTAAIAHGGALFNQPLDSHVAKASPTESPVIAIPDQWSARKRYSTLVQSCARSSRPRSGLLQITVTGHRGLPLRRLASSQLARQFSYVPFQRVFVVARLVFRLGNTVEFQSA
jgi:hypothetical protein